MLQSPAARSTAWLFRGERFFCSHRMPVEAMGGEHLQTKRHMWPLKSKHMSCNIHAGGHFSLPQCQSPVHFPPLSHSHMFEIHVKTVMKSLRNVCVPAHAFNQVHV